MFSEVVLNKAMTYLYVLLNYFVGFNPDLPYKQMYLLYTYLGHIYYIFVITKLRW